MPHPTATINSSSNAPRNRLVDQRLLAMRAGKLSGGTTCVRQRFTHAAHRFPFLGEWRSAQQCGIGSCRYSRQLTNISRPEFHALRSIGTPSAHANYLTRQQVAQIYHVGSFLPQHYGTIFNVRISIHHGKLGVRRHDDAVALASGLTHAIRLKLEYRLPRTSTGSIDRTFMNEIRKEDW